jgi:phage-related minor tail protein
MLMADSTASDRVVVSIAADLSPLSQSLAQAGRDVNSFAADTVGGAARTMSDSFSSASRSLTSGILKATETGKLSVRDMVDSIVRDLARVAIKDFVVAPIENAAKSIVGSIASSIGGLAVGGPVAPGTAYVVGERGPELFVPSGNIVPNTAPARPQIVLNVQARDAQSFIKSESQIAAMMMRALARGQKNL